MEWTDQLGESSLYLIAGRSETHWDEYLDRLRDAFRAGLDLVQFREKTAEEAERLSLASEIADLAAEFHCPFLVNDDPRLAVVFGARGIHVGQDDLEPAQVREIVGAKMAIGLSTHSQSQLVSAEANTQVQMMGLGPIFPTTTKDAGPALGAEIWAKWAVQEMRKPVFAIGGINRNNLVELLEFGCRRIAVSSAILNADDVGREVRQLQEMLRG